ACLPVAVISSASLASSVLLLNLLRLRTAGDADLCALFHHGAVLSDEFRWHLQLALRLAQIPVGRERRVLALGQVQLEAVDRYVGDGLECAARDPRFVDERCPGQIDP